MRPREVIEDSTSDLAVRIRRLRKSKCSVYAKAPARAHLRIELKIPAIVRRKIDRLLIINPLLANVASLWRQQARAARAISRKAEIRQIEHRHVAHVKSRIEKMEEFALFIEHAAAKFDAPIRIGDVAARYAGALHAVILAIAAAGVVLHPKLGVLIHHKIYVGLLLIVFQIDFDMLRTRSFTAAAHCIDIAEKLDDAVLLVVCSAIGGDEVVLRIHRYVATSLRQKAVFLDIICYKLDVLDLCARTTC